MSHLVTIETKLHDVAALQAACQRMKLEAPTWGTATLYSGEANGLLVKLPDWLYPAGLDPQLQFPTATRWIFDGSYVTAMNAVRGISAHRALSIGDRDGRLDRDLSLSVSTSVISKPEWSGPSARRSSASIAVCRTAGRPPKSQASPPS